MYTVLLPPGVNPIAVKYIISYFLVSDYKNLNITFFTTPRGYAHFLKVIST